MTDHPQQGWEPDPRRVGNNWRSLFDQHPQRQGTLPPSAAEGPVAAASPETDDAAALDATDYRPWIIQRGRSRSVMMLHLRRFDPRTSMPMGWVLPYSSLYGIEYVGDRMLSLDFGVRQFVVEGRGLDGLLGALQSGSIQAVVEYCPALWPKSPDGAAIVTTIRRAGLEG